MSSLRGTTRQYWVAVRAMIVFTLVLGIGYPLVVTGVGALFPAQAHGSLFRIQGSVVGSSLIGQSFADKKGNALPEWFQSRPSAAGYDGGASSGSNQGTENAALIAAVKQRRAAIAKLDGVAPSSIPADALTASASGLDPQISPDYAREQVARVAATRGLKESDVAQLVESFVRGRQLGYLSSPTVDVLDLNVALAKLHG
jgi:K+-transporting ATPase ATPase C chain